LIFTFNFHAAAAWKHPLSCAFDGWDRLGGAVVRQQVVACFEAGKAVLCEKPISHDPERLGR
jgi:hypothetical protein